MSDLVSAFERTAEATEGLDREVDASLIESGRTMSRRIQEAVDGGDGAEVTKALYLIPHLLNILREMGATPAARGAVPDGSAGSAVVGKLAELKSIAGGRAGGSGA